MWQSPIFQKILRKLNITFTLFILTLSAGGLTVTTTVFAALTDTSQFQITISAGSLSAEIVDGSYATVTTPTVNMSDPTFGFTCQTSGSTGLFGTATEQIYVQNPDAADGGWTLSISANDGATDFWDSAGTDMDFNDATNTGGIGCGEDSTSEPDTIKGMMTVDASVGGGADLAVGQCGSCVITNITQEASDNFDEGGTDSIVMLTAAAASNDIGDWTLQNVVITQTIPAEQPAAADYDIDMRITVAAT